MNRNSIKCLTLMLITLSYTSSCALGTVVGTATDVAVEVVKVPFKVGGAIVDAVDKGDDDKKE